MAFNEELVDIYNDMINNFKKVAANQVNPNCKGMEELWGNIQAMGIGICCEANEYMDDTHIWHIRKSDRTIYCSDKVNKNDMAMRYLTDEEAAKANL